MKNIKIELVFLIITIFAGLAGFLANATDPAKANGSGKFAYPTPPPPAPTPYPPISYPAPSVIWNTFEGSSGADYGSDIDADYNGNIYVTGTSNNATWDGSPINPWAGADDAFVAKLNQDGVLQWYTFLGGAGSDSGTSIFVDNGGNIFITGKSDSSWGSNPVRDFQSNNDAFVAKLNSNGDLQWHTFLGGTADDQGEDVVESSGTLLLTGTSFGSWGGGADPNPTRAYTTGIGSDAFVAKLSSTGVLQWHTFLGGADYDNAAKISDGYTGLYAIGQSHATWGTPVRLFGGTTDAYVANLNWSTGVLQWNTFLGGTNSEDAGHGISVQRYYYGNYFYDSLYVAGESSKSWGSPVNPFNGVSAHDGFLAKLNSLGQIEWNTFLGGSAYDSVSDIQYKNHFSILVTGVSQESWGTPSIPFHGSGSTQDGFVASFDPSGNYQWNTFLGADGGLDGDAVNAITTLWGTKLFVTGYSKATWGASPIHAFSGDADAFIARLGEIPIPPVVVSIVRANPNPTNVATVDFIVTFSKDVAGVDATDFIFTTSGVSGATISGIIDGSDVYTVTVNTGSGDGTIRLDVMDDNSIGDYSYNSLGGVALGDGNFITGEVYTVNKSSIFADVPLTYWSSNSIERLYAAHITGGCMTIPLNYCPTTPVTRAQMAIFLLRGMHGSAYTPPPATGAKFNDVPLGTFGDAWIEQLATEGITSGCGGGNYCPTQTVSRAQMAIFLVRAKHGSTFVPPTATGVFPDVPVGSFGANYIEQLVADGITSGCGGGLYCPNTMVKRDSMAVFLVKTFGLP